MIVSAIAAIDKMGLIGNGAKMPWHLPRDLRRFREHTLGKPIILGRRTFQSLRAPLQGRRNIILTHNPSFRAEGCHIAHSLDEALSLAEEYAGQVGGDEVMIIGGGDVFEATVSLWDRLLLTVIEGEFQGDSYFPLDRVTEARWSICDREFCGADAKTPHPHWFLLLERQRSNHPAYQDFDLASWLSSQPASTADLSHAGVKRRQRQEGECGNGPSLADCSLAPEPDGATVPQRGVSEQHPWSRRNPGLQET